MRTLTKTWLAAVAAVILLSTPTMSAEAGDLKDASEIVNRTNTAQYYAAKDGRALVRMKIVDSKGRSQRRQFAVLRRDKATRTTSSSSTSPQTFGARRSW
jgi:hypothetical protein